MKRKLKILVIESDEKVSKFICSVLESKGYKTSKAYDGEQALIAVELESPDLITIEVNIPKINGFEVCKKLKSAESTKNIPIIFLTNASDIDQIVHGYDIDADHYITKPFMLVQFLAQLNMSLRRTGHINKTTSLTDTVIPKVFISYKWEDEDHNKWVMKLAENLRRAGIESFLDQWEVRLGDSFTDYMTSKIHEADVMLFIMTTASVKSIEEKSNKGGALKFEMQLATSRKIAGEKLRIIPIYKEGDNTAAYVRNHRYADFTDDSKYEDNLQMLIEDLLGLCPLPPPIGKR